MIWFEYQPGFRDVVKPETGKPASLEMDTILRLHRVKGQSHLETKLQETKGEYREAYLGYGLVQL